MELVNYAIAMGVFSVLYGLGAILTAEEDTAQMLEQYGLTTWYSRNFKAIRNLLKDKNNENK